jgi:hypothetical protein
MITLQRSVLAVVAGLALAPPAVAQTPVVRPAASIDGFSVVADAEATLGADVASVRGALESAGYVEVSFVGTPTSPSGWNYERDRVRVEVRAAGDSVRSIARIERGRSDDERLEFGRIEARFIEWFGLDEEDCARRDGAVACTVRNEGEGDPSRVATAQLSPMRTVVRATRLGDPGGG